MTAETIRTAIRNYIVNRVLDGDGGELKDDSPLLEWGVLNSLQILGLVDYIEDEFEVRIEPEDLKPQNLSTIIAISNMISERAK